MNIRPRAACLMGPVLDPRRLTVSPIEQIRDRRVSLLGINEAFVSGENELLLILDLSALLDIGDVLHAGDRAGVTVEIRTRLAAKREQQQL